MVLSQAQPLLTSLAFPQRAEGTLQSGGVDKESCVLNMEKVDETIGTQEPGLPGEKFTMRNHTLP